MSQSPGPLYQRDNSLQVLFACPFQGLFSLPAELFHPAFGVCSESCVLAISVWLGLLHQQKLNCTPAAVQGLDTWHWKIPMEKQGGTKTSQQLGNPTMQKHMERSKHAICVASGQPWSQQAPKGYVDRPKYAWAATSETGIPELFSLSKRTRRSLAGEELEILYKMEQEWGKKDFHQFYMAQ